MTAEPGAPGSGEPFGVPGFEVLELLGFGGTGEVWLAKEGASGDTVALKRLRPGSAPDAWERLRHEAALLGSLRHPHLVRLRAVVELPDDFVLVLDHAGAGNLEGLLGDRGALAPGEVVTVLTPLAEALEDLHCQGVVHGDVAPANIVLDRSGRPLLADLGIARVLGTPVAGIHGREAFLDPAVLAGEAPTPSSDVYALAAVGLAALGSEADGAPPAHELREVLGRALAGEALLRPTAGELAALVFAACPPVPLILPPARAGNGGRGPARLRRSTALGDHAASRAGGQDSGSPGDTWESGGSPDGRRDDAPEDGDVTHRVRPAPVLPTGPPPGSARNGAWLRRWPRRAPQDAAAWLTTLPPLPAHPGRESSAGASTAPRWWAGVSGAGERAEQWHRGPLLLGLAACSGLVLAALVGVAWASVDRPDAGTVLAGPAPGAAVPAPTPLWPSILAELDAARAEAYLTGDAALLQRAYAPQAPAGERDAQSLAALTGGDRRVEGLRLSTTAVSPLEVTANQAVLRVVDTLAPHVLVTRGSGARQSMPGRGERSWTVTLRRAGSGWQIWEVLEGDTWPAAEP